MNNIEELFAEPSHCFPILFPSVWLFMEKIKLTYPILASTVVSVDYRWRSVPKGFIHRFAQTILSYPGQVLQYVQRVLEVLV